MKDNKYFRFVKRSDEELKADCSDDFAYKLIKTFVIYENALYKSVSNITQKLNLDELVEVMSYSSPLNNELIGIFIPKGWENLLWELSEKLENLCSKIRVTQVKEKLGQLCFYTEKANNRQKLLIESYRKLSRRTCMCCGEMSDKELVKEVKQKAFYITTLCDVCENKLNNY